MALKRKAFWGALVVAGFSLGSRALQAQPEASPSQEAPALQQETNASASEASTPLRDPFWPIGYAPAKTAPVAKPVDQKGPEPAAIQVNMDKLTPEQMNKLKALINMGGFMRQGDRHFVFINRRLVTKGDSIDISFEGAVYRFIIRDVTDQNAVLEPMEDEATTDLQKTGGR